MCTAITYKTKDFYFGRTLDYEISYAEEVTITPRRFPFPLRDAKCMDRHYAIIGMACVKEIPLYYDAVNEKGLCMAGLNFVGNAYYNEIVPHRTNIAQFELIPYVLGNCSSVKESVRLLKQINISDRRYSEELPVAQLHWLIADKDGAVTVENMKNGMRIYENPAGVLTNNPPFPELMLHLNDFMSLSPRQPKNLLSERLPLTAYSRGMGALGLPGDLSSRSRFVRAVFTKLNSISGDSEEDSVNQFFHILGAVEQQRGCCIVDEENYETTIYTSCCNAERGIYYYTTYENHSISAVSLKKEDLEGSTLRSFPLVRRERITPCNG